MWRARVNWGWGPKAVVSVEQLPAAKAGPPGARPLTPHTYARRVAARTHTHTRQWGGAVTTKRTDRSMSLLSLNDGMMSTVSYSACARAGVGRFEALGE